MFLATAAKSELVISGLKPLGVGTLEEADHGPIALCLILIRHLIFCSRPRALLRQRRTPGVEDLDSRMLSLFFYQSKAFMSLAFYGLLKFSGKFLIVLTMSPLSPSLSNAMGNLSL